MPRSGKVSDAALDFGRNLKRYLVLRKMTQSDLARAVEVELGQPFGRDNISNYINGRALPRETGRLEAIAKVLKVETEDLIPNEARPSIMRNPETSFVELDDDMVHVRINKRVPKDMARRLYAIVHGLKVVDE